MKHRADCQKYSAIHTFLTEYYKSWWPNYCRRCRGWGGLISYYDPSPSGVSLSSGRMQEIDLCPDCMDKRLCPRCGNVNIGWLEGEGDVWGCATCGWSFEDPGGLPEPPECCCDMYCEECGKWMDLWDEGPRCKKCEERPRHEKIAEYLNAPSFCPWCGDDGIETRGHIECDSTIAWVEVECEKCDRIWREEFKLVAISWRVDKEERIYSDEDMGI
jgi:hypothetical protein